MRSFDPTLYFVTCRELLGTQRFEESILQAIKGGVTLVQLREKKLHARDFIREARKLHILLQAQKVPLIINDRVDVALASEAEGVHLGQDDMLWKDARRILGPKAIIGVSVESLSQAEMLQNADIDYIAASPIWQTYTKIDTWGAWGLDGLKELRKNTQWPIVGIGGINVTNAEQVIAAGADGVAVVSALCNTPDPKSRSEDLLRSITHGRNYRAKHGAKIEP